MRVKILTMALKLGLFISLFGVTGCSLIPSHIHNAANEEAAVKAQAEMAEYSKNSSSTYTTMLSNVEKFKVEEDRLLSELAMNYDTALVPKSPTRTWEDFRTRAIQVRQSLSVLEKRVTEAVKEYLITEKNLQGEVSSAEDALKAAQGAVQQAQGEVEAWNASVALFQKAFEKLPEVSEQLRAPNKTG